MRTLLTGVLMACWAAMATAAPVDPAHRDAALAVYASWNKAIAAGKLNDALAFRTARLRTRIAPDIKTASQRKSVTELLKSMVPDTVEVLHVSQAKDGKLTLRTVVGMVVPPGPRRQGMPEPGSALQAELSLDFLREGGGWKFDNQSWGMDPRKVKPCAASYGGMGGFEERENLMMGGEIRRVAFAADHTLVVIRMSDEENCIFLPPRARLVELGFNPDQLEPWAIIEIGAWPHRDDRQSVWADTLKIVDAE